MITIYHNPRCSKSRECLLILEETVANPETAAALKNAHIETVKYIDSPLDFDTLSSIIKKLGITPLELVRKNEAIWKENYKGKTLSDKEILTAMIEHPKLMERPIVVNGDKAIIGRPPSRVLEIL
ncbi:arsenate reductase [unidentified eubacterium SCB49]|nr:arsenate reductase [unidentified eubacterium SCB49]